MSVGLLLITHNNLGSDLLETATKMLGQCPLQARTLAVTLSADPDLLLERAQRLLEGLNRGPGVLVLTDMFGSTPANIATALCREGEVAVVAGLNLPMLVRVLNYPQLELPALVEKALSGGHDGVVFCQTK
jgi:PTS system ascorbate-specific IIA component